ncbi:hypothetical protein CBR_g37537 [Chara braunii]|uniref:CHCH domain-containing protein n=1 Tax=Chara braunii TaxID=69332 RepID=A0A388LN16_CHABU|nr:hypothetical protein CBR_g37537 [Chara braunii]|eukprot:GBG83736.1 hypothetical protein CBR_g37537 [Chara braunii]
MEREEERGKEQGKQREKEEQREGEREKEREEEREEEQEKEQEKEGERGYGGIFVTLFGEGGAGGGGGVGGVGGAGEVAGGGVGEGGGGLGGETGTVDAVMGPRGGGAAPAAAAPEPLAASSPFGGQTVDACANQAKAFQDCLEHNNSDIGKCQFYIDMLTSCRHNGTMFQLVLYGYGGDGGGGGGGEAEPRRQWVVSGHTESCRCVKFSDGGRVVVSGSPDKSILLTDAATGRIVSRRSDAHLAAINRLMVLPDARVATGDDDGAVKIWDMRQNNCCHTFAVHEDFISDMTPGPSNNQLIVTSGDGSLSVCNVRQNRVDGRSEMVEDELLSVAVLKHGRKVVCGTQDGLLLIYAWGTWSEFSDRFPGHPSSVDALVKVDEDTILTGSSDGLIRVVSIVPNKMLGVIGEHSDYPIERLGYSFDKRFIASASHDRSVKLWDVAYLLEGDDEGDGAAANNGNDVDMEQPGHDMDSDDDGNQGGGGGGGGGRTGGGVGASGRRPGRQRGGGRDQQQDNSFFADL